MRFITYLLAGCTLVAGTLFEMSELSANLTHLFWLVAGASGAAAIYLLIAMWENKKLHQQLLTKELLQNVPQFWLEAAMAGFVILVFREMRLQAIELPMVMLAVPVVFAFWLEQTSNRQKG
jgi:hypothetical protein